MPYEGARETAAALIRQFWKAHREAEPPLERAYAEMDAWTRPGHAGDWPGREIYARIPALPPCQL